MAIKNQSYLSKTMPDLVDRHIIDSLQLFSCRPSPRSMDGSWQRRRLSRSSHRHLSDRKIDQGWVHLIESNNKKAAFLRQVISITGARASVLPVRIDAAQGELGPIDAISARALAALTDLFTLLPLLPRIIQKCRIVVSQRVGLP
jgi:16S rRNA (guanine527-N7)-methyltransferase